MQYTSPCITDVTDTRLIMTMPLIPRILATCALCLAAVGLSSCISATHRVVKAWGQSADEVYWANELGGTTDCLYRVGNELYVQGYRSSGEVTMGVENCFGGIWMYPEEAVYEVTPHADKAEKVWLRLSDKNWSDAQRYFRTGETRYSSDYISLRVTSHDALTELPSHAARLAVPRTRRVNLVVQDGLSAGKNWDWERDEYGRPSDHISADAHALYAYPLAGALFLGVDVPLTLVNGVWAIPATAIGAIMYYK